ncbi:MAG: HAD family hydrolase [Chloroflexi bacterium]|nr:HAD family hydrolase [Chloroflexota bacterium]
MTLDKLGIGSPQLVIFDKDGTLIDFHAMWGRWLVEVAERLEAALGAPVADRLYQMMKYDPVSGKVSDGPLAGTTMESIRRLTAATLHDSGLAAEAVEAALQVAWHLPNPVALAQPLTHLPTLFGQLHERGAKVAVATIDDREPTQATFAGLGVASMIEAMACADDGLPLKPAPDMILFICRKLNISPAQTVMVGDSTQDLKMARAAGVGLAVGVSSGVTPAETLSPLADIVLPSIAELV